MPEFMNFRENSFARGRNALLCQPLGNCRRKYTKPDYCVGPECVKIPDPSARAEFAARLVVRLVANSFDIDEAVLFGGGRGASEISRARQIAIYLLHTSLSIPYGVLARLFRRDRTTVAHACRTIEDLRDNPAKDNAISKLEGILELLAQLAGMDEKTFATR